VLSESGMIFVSMCYGLMFCFFFVVLFFGFFCFGFIAMILILGMSSGLNLAIRAVCSKVASLGASFCVLEVV